MAFLTPKKPKQPAKRILIVDDTEFYRKAYRERLTGAGYEVLSASSGAEGLRMVVQEQPDLILLDLNMQQMDGFQVLRVIKDDPKFKSIPVIVFSVRGASEEVKRAIAMGAADYLAKAATHPSKVLDKIKQVLAAASTAS
jgi:CheY-like chemotaxis protein